MDFQRWRDRVYTVAIIVSLLSLATLVINIQRRDARLEAEHQAQAAQAEAETQRRREGGRAIQARLTEALADMPEGFVVWGDANAMGNGRGSLSAAFADKLDDVFFAPLRGEFSRRAELYDAVDFRIDVANMGTQNEGFRELLARMGAGQLSLGEDFELPAGAERRVVALADRDGRPLYFAEQPYAKFGATTIGGVEGFLYLSRGTIDREHTQVEFGRSVAGEGFVVPAGTPVETEGATAYRGRCLALFFSEYADAAAEDFIGGLWEAISLYGEQGRYYAVLCVTEEGSDWDQALAAAFGERYLRCDSPAARMTASDYGALAERLYACYREQGLFDKIQAATDEAMAALEGLE